MGIRFEISEVQMGLGPLGLLGYEKLKQYLRSKGALFWRRGGGASIVIPTTQMEKQSLGTKCSQDHRAR